MTPTMLARSSPRPEILAIEAYVPERAASLESPGCISFHPMNRPLRALGAYGLLEYLRLTVGDENQAVTTALTLFMQGDRD